MESKLLIVDGEFDPFEQINAYQKNLDQGKYGAACHFIGTMRDFNLDDNVTSMELQHYPGMTEKQLKKILDSATQQWKLSGLLVIHRVGEISPGDNIVLCAAWSAHRDVAFEACRYLIEELKHKAPFWKKETLTEDNKDRWVS